MADNVAVIGDNDSIKGFAAVGFDIFNCDSAEDAKKTFLRIACDNYAIIFITEEYYQLLGKELKKYENNPTPSVVPIPGVKGNNGAGIKRLSGFVERAVGSDIIFNN